ncbi:MAG: autotransporter outer membrane beta-barrel domain-containing protein [Pseudomonadota bacterium]
MNTKKKCIGLLMLIGTVAAVPVLAQDGTPPPTTPVNLITFVNNTEFGATELQRGIGTGVQRACAALAGQGGFQLEGQQLDLFARCNELVQTSQRIQDGNMRARDLGLSSDELLGAIQEIAGEELLGNATMSTRVTSGQFSNIAGRLNSLRLGTANSAIGGRVAYADPIQIDSPNQARMSLNDSNVRGGAAAADVAGSRVGWFLEGNFGTGDRDQTTNEDGFEFDSTSFTLGLDYTLDRGVIGVAFGIDNYEADFDTNAVVSGGDLDVDGAAGSLFGAYNLGSWFINGIVSFGTIDNDTARRVVYSGNPNCPPAPQACPDIERTLSGSTDGDYLAGGATIGYDFAVDSWDIAASLSLAYRDIDIDGYTETDSSGGGLPLAYDDQTIESFRAILGVNFARTISRDFGVVVPQLRLEWHHEFQDQPLELVAKYAVEETLPGGAGPGVFAASQCISCFQINSGEIDTDFGLVGLGVSAVFSRRWQLYGVYEGIFGLEDITSNTFSIGLRAQF